ncbi:pantoate--beta-alanine ligase [Ignavibacteria bacterium]|nr:pantoate--beta-alanine ligase [Bacteroidota bacterium]MCZ2132130.1 pantoate--beta-alanine ligase [Bacteroidota bacterium]
MRIIRTVAEMQQYSEEHRKAGRRVAVIPTMGYLHEGHASLIQQARKNADIAVTTLFVNKLQFGANEDFSRYPRDFVRDCTIAEEAGSDALFAPENGEMYTETFSTVITVRGISDKFEGAFRRGHFDGVATIVAKLFGAVRPHEAYFGQKDYQQTLVIRRMTADLNLGVNIIVCPTLREADGLAMSSRNVYLAPEERGKASVLHRALQTASLLVQSGEIRRQEINFSMLEVLRTVGELQIDYACAAQADTLEEPEVFEETEPIVFLIAARLGAARLIDNEVWQAVK